MTIGILVGVFLLVVLCAGLAMMGLYVVWRRGYVRGWHAARVDGPRCPGCGYNLSGLNQCRCPECGGEFGLDEITTFVPERAGDIRGASG